MRMQAQDPDHLETDDAAAVAYERWRTPTFAPPRRRWPAIVAALAIGGVAVGLAVSSYYEEATLGERIDHTLGRAGQAVQSNVEAMRDSAATQTGRLAEAVSDASITAGVKTALAADPQLSALKIDVSTRDGVVSLEGPAPDEKARERAATLAAAPDGVVRVDNRLAVPSADGAIATRPVTRSP
jgi:hyperosmotically inducible protein